MKYLSKEIFSGKSGRLLKSVADTRAKKTTVIFFIAIFASLVYLHSLEQSLLAKYERLESVTIKDRNGAIISIEPNAKGEFSSYKKLPTPFEKLLVKKEDRFFYLHLGINPISIARAAVRSLIGEGPGGSSTITQQLAKNLLGNENDRNIKNKIVEALHTLGMEVYLTKKTILEMYANTVYMGNNIQGFGQASIDYYGKELNDLSESEFISLLATVSNPEKHNPWKKENKSLAKSWAERFNIDFDDNISIKDIPDAYVHKSPASFEYESLKVDCMKSCVTTLDADLTERLRKILRRNISLAWDSGARNGSIVVLKLPENELLSIVGSPDPTSKSNGHSINMAISPRPIGSTAKPFIYLRAFEKGLRPYSLVEDREYKYPIATGYPLYPKNYDGLYRGTVTLHESLSNSYNVPTVKTLEYVGLADFYYFLQDGLGFIPLRDLDEYQFGIALGGLEMDPLSLAHYFSIFPERGTHRPLKLFLNGGSNGQNIIPPMGRQMPEKKVSDPKYAELVTKILQDRKTGIEQFGLKSSLNLTQDNYAVKTGTSRDYHDSWTVGYTPDYLVAVWLGNAENEPLKHVTGQSGAGSIWNETMELLAGSKYNNKTPFAYESIKAFMIDGSIDFGIIDDVISEHKDLMQDKSLILFPHSGETVLLEKSTILPLRSSRSVLWYVNGSYLGEGAKTDFSPKAAGKYVIEARSNEETESVSISVVGQ